jgi:hypothetical protein
MGTGGELSPVSHGKPDAALEPLSRTRGGPQVDEGAQRSRDRAVPTGMPMASAASIGV